MPLDEITKIQESKSEVKITIDFPLAKEESNVPHNAFVTSVYTSEDDNIIAGCEFQIPSESVKNYFKSTDLDKLSELVS